jgi:hypothetical protein
MAPQTLQAVYASSWASPLPLPFWLTSTAKRNSKVRLHGILDAIYLEHGRLVVQAGEDDLIWVFIDVDTRFVGVLPEALVVGQKLQIDGLLQANRLQATRVFLLH